MTHLCLVSDQPMPNFLPILHSVTKPEQVILAVTDKMATKADWLKKAIENRKIDVRILPIPNAYNLAVLQDFFINWLDKDAPEDIVLNVTGGTKPMAIAAQEAFRMANKPVFYISVESDELIWLETRQGPIKMTTNLSLKTFFTIHGFQMEKNNRQGRLKPEWQTYSKILVENVIQWEQALGKLNRHAMLAEQRNVLDCGRVTAENTLSWDELMESLYYNEVICYQDRLVFKSPEARSFANGGWLEHLVFEAVKEVLPDSKPQLNVIIKDARGNQNELDVAVLVNHSLFIIECKTKRFVFKDDFQNGPAAETIYKLDSLRKTGGLRTQGVLISFRPVGPDHKKRAEEAKISVIDQSGLPRLKQLLAQTIK